MKMKIYPEIKKIAGHVAAMEALVEKLTAVLPDDFDITGMEWHRAYLLSGCKERKGHLFRKGVILDNDPYGFLDNTPHGPDKSYYCFQRAGCMEDSYVGTLYFKTNVPGQFVAVPFDM